MIAESTSAFHQVKNQQPNIGTFYPVLNYLINHLLTRGHIPGHSTDWTPNYHPGRLKIGR